MSIYTEPVRIDTLRVFKFFSFAKNGEEDCIEKILPHSNKRIEIHIESGQILKVKKSLIVFVDYI